MGLPITIRLNGKAFTRNSVSIRPNGLTRFKDVDSVSWSDERPSELVQPMNDGGISLGKAVGNYTCDASISVFLDACGAFEEIIALSPGVTNPLDLSSVNFQLPIIIREEVRVRSVILVNCTIKKRSVSVGSDGTALVQEYGLQPTMILEDGRSLISLIPAL
jgi:hypothetical protein